MTNSTKPGVNPTENHMQYIKLIDVYEGEFPGREEGIWEHVGNMDFQKSFGVRTMNPVEWFNAPTGTGQTPKNVYEYHAQPWQRKLVKQYKTTVTVQNAERYVVVYNDEVVDGWHRMVAFALAGMTEARVVDLNIEQES